MDAILDQVGASPNDVAGLAQCTTVAINGLLQSPDQRACHHRLPASLGDARVSMPIRKRGCWIADDTPRRLPRHRLLINYQQAKADRPLTTSMRTLPRGSQKAIVEPAHGLGVMIDGIFLCRSSLLYLAGTSPLFYRIAYLLVFFVSLTLIWQGIAGLETTNGRTIWTTSH